MLRKMTTAAFWENPFNFATALSIFLILVAILFGWVGYTLAQQQNRLIIVIVQTTTP